MGCSLSHSKLSTGPGRHPNDHFTKLPAEVVLGVIEALSDPKRQHYSSHLTLLSLCLTSERLRSLAQPLLFSKINLTGKVRETLFAARRLEELFNTRAGSAEWVKELVLQWKLPNELSSAFPGASIDLLNGNPNPTIESGFEAEMLYLASSLLKRMSNLRHFKAEQIPLSQEMYAQLYRLPKLKHAVFPGITYLESPSDNDLPTEALTIFRLVVLRRRVTGAPSAYTMPRAILRLARSSSLRHLHLWVLTSEALAEAIGPQRSNLANLQTLEIADESSPFQVLLDFSQYTPNLENLSLGFCDPDPLSGPGRPSSLTTSIPSTTWPHLKSFRGTLRAARLFAPHRPLEKLEIFAGSSREKQEVSTEVLAVLASSTGVVKHLQLSGFAWRSKCVEEIAYLFPELETLRISGVGPYEVSGNAPKEDRHLSLTAFSCFRYGFSDIWKTWSRSYQSYPLCRFPLGGNTSFARLLEKFWTSMHA